MGSKRIQSGIKAESKQALSSFVAVQDNVSVDSPAAAGGSIPIRRAVTFLGRRRRKEQERDTSQGLVICQPPLRSMTTTTTTLALHRL